MTQILKCTDKMEINSHETNREEGDKRLTVFCKPHSKLIFPSMSAKKLWKNVRNMLKHLHHHMHFQKYSSF